MGHKRRRNRKRHSRKKKSAAAAADKTIFLRLLLYSSDKLTVFRIKELKDILSQLGLSKQGKKQDLVDRIIAILSDEQVSRTWAKKNVVVKEEIVKLIEDSYRKVKASLGPDLASNGTSLSDTSDVKPKVEIDDPFQPGSKIRCPCGSSLPTDSMIKCEDPRCCVWQHIGCVIIPDKPVAGSPSYPERFYCEICRLGRADPFLVTMGHQLYPVKLNATNIPTDGANPVQSVEKTFQLVRADKNLLTKQDYDLQAWCMLLNDKVPFRMQWPQYADLHVNGMPIRAINRPGSQLLGINGRDDGPIITPCVKDGINKISLNGCDARVFCLGVRLVKRRSVQQILSLIPKKSDGEPFEDALTRVRRCVNGGTSTDDADSDSDIEVVADSFTVNLRCPMSGSRIKVAGRFKPCLHMGCFDLEVFVEMNQRSRKWQCPICLKNYALEHIIIDPYFNGITAMMLNCGEDVTEVELKSDGSWRVKSKRDIERRDLGDLGLWHFPDCSLSVPAEREKTEMEIVKQIKQEGFSESHPSLKLGIKKNRNGVWEVSQPEDFNTLLSCNRLQEGFEQKNIIMSSSATGSGRDGEDPSVNQDTFGNFDFSTNNGIELDSNVGPTYGFTYQNTSIAQQGNPDIVILSDSEEEDLLISSGPVYENNQTDASGINFPVPRGGTSVSYQNDPIIEAGGNSCLGLFNPNDEVDYGMSLWSLPPATQTCSGFQLFSSEKEVTDKLVDVQQHYAMDTTTILRTIAPDTDSVIARSVPDISEGLVDNSLSYGGEDPSLQFFLPTRPSGESIQTRLRDEGDISNGIQTDDWISLRLGGSSSCSGHGELATTNRLNSGTTLPPREDALDSLTDTASFLLGMNDGRSDKLIPKTGGPFSFPRQKRSKRPRLYFSINSDSE